MIPKIIHYCWFGGGEKSNLMKKCMESWKQYCPDYEIIEWNESNIDISECVYAQQAMEQKKWSFVSDYVRYDVLYNYGGIYLDTDVMLIKSPEPLLQEKAYMGFDQPDLVNTGVGFGAEKNNPIIGEILDYFKGMKLIQDDGSINYEIQPGITTKILERHGLKIPDCGIQKLENITIFPCDYFAPKSYNSVKMVKTENTYSIHMYLASWQSEAQRKKHKKEIYKDYITHLPNRALLKILGEKKYNSLKKR